MLKTFKTLITFSTRTTPTDKTRIFKNSKLAQISCTVLQKRVDFLSKRKQDWNYTCRPQLMKLKMFSLAKEGLNKLSSDQSCIGQCY